MISPTGVESSRIIEVIGAAVEVIVLDSRINGQTIAKDVSDKKLTDSESTAYSAVARSTNIYSTTVLAVSSWL